MVHIPFRTPYRKHGTGIYRREMNVKTAPGVAIGEMVDDFHHFRVTIYHDDETVQKVVAEAVRPPWSTCADTIETIKALEGMPLHPSLRAVGKYTPIKNQCTHMFDAAALAIARLGRGLGNVIYSIAIPDRDQNNQTTVELKRDGELLFTWELEDNTIIGPEQFSGQKIIGGGLAGWAEATLDVDTLEATLLSQRACLISHARAMDLESYSCAEEVPGGPTGACHTFTSGTIEQAVRMVGSARDLTNWEGPLGEAS